MDSLHSDGWGDHPGLSRAVSWPLVVCQVLAVSGVVLGLIVGGATGRTIAAVGAVALLLGPFVVLAQIALLAGRRRPSLVAYAAGTLLVAALGVWLAR